MSGLKALRQLLVAENGATLAEYALIVGFIAVVVFAAVANFGTALAGMYRSIATAVQGS